DHLVEQPDLRVELPALRVVPQLAVLVHELPDDRGADHRDRHRHEDERLGQLLELGTVHEHRIDQADAGRDDRHEEHPQRGIAQHKLELGLGDGSHVVLEAEEVLAVAVVERRDRGADGRIDEAETDEYESRAREDGCDEPAAGTAGPVDEPQQEAHDAHEDGDDDDRQENLLAGRVRDEQEVADLTPQPAEVIADVVQNRPLPPVVMTRARPRGVMERPRPHCRAAHRDLPARTGPGAEVLHSNLADDHGQDASIASRTAWVSLPSANQLVISRQKLPAPTAAGMRSEASKRITELGSPSTDEASLSKSVARLLTSRPELAVTQPPPSVAMALALAHVSEIRRAHV